MEKQKKKISKKAVVICSVVLAVVLIAGGVLTYKYVTRERLYTFDEITQGLSKQVSYVEDNDHKLSQKEIDLLYESYKHYKYKSVDRSNGDFLHCLVFYDNQGNALFSIVKFDRYGIIIVNINEMRHRYCIDI